MTRVKRYPMSPKFAWAFLSHLKPFMKPFYSTKTKTFIYWNGWIVWPPPSPSTELQAEAIHRCLAAGLKECPQRTTQWNLCAVICLNVYYIHDYTCTFSRKRLSIGFSFQERSWDNTSSHLTSAFLTSSYPIYIFTSYVFAGLSSSHLATAYLTSSHLHILNLHRSYIFTDLTSSDLKSTDLTSSHLKQILHLPILHSLSLSLSLFPSANFYSLLRQGGDTKWGSIVKNWGKMRFSLGPAI